MPVRKVQTQEEKVIDYQYIRSLKNKQVRKKRFQRSLSQKVFRLTLILLLLTEIGYLSYYGFQFLKKSPLFALNHVEVTGTVKTKPEEIRKILIADNPNLLLVDLTALKLRLESHPWIENAVIWRELPGTLRVHLIERRPVALVLFGNLYLVDRSGKVIDEFDQDPRYADLPVITGVEDITATDDIRQSLEYVEALAGEPEILKLVSEINTYDKDNTIVYLKGMPFGLLVSKDGILPMIKKFVEYSEVVKKNFGNAKWIDLRYRGQIILKDFYREQL